jgi:hypothetical protein
MTKLRVAFHNFVNAPKTEHYKVFPITRAKYDQYIDDAFQTPGFYVPILFDNKFTYITDPKAGCVVRDVQRGRMSVEPWYGYWHIKINEDQTQAMYFSRGNRPIFHEQTFLNYLEHFDAKLDRRRIKKSPHN